MLHSPGTNWSSYAPCKNLPEAPCTLIYSQKCCLITGRLLGSTFGESGPQMALLLHLQVFSDSGQAWLEQLLGHPKSISAMFLLERNRFSQQRRSSANSGGNEEINKGPFPPGVAVTENKEVPLLILGRDSFASALQALLRSSLSLLFLSLVPPFLQ